MVKCNVFNIWTSELLYTLIYKTQTYTYLSTASLMSLIQVFRSSLDDVWTSYISGPAADALIKNIPLSSFATSRTISFCRAMTGGFWSWRTLKVQRISSLQDKIEKVIECRTETETRQTAVLEPGYVCLWDQPNAINACIPQWQMYTSGLFLAGRWVYLWEGGPAHLGEWG